METPNRLALTTFLLACCVRSLSAQEATPTPSDAVRWFAESIRTTGAPTGDPKGQWVIRFVVHPEQFDRATVSAVLDGLEQLAVTDSNERVRVAAVTWLASIGESSLENAQGFGVVPRLRALYRRTVIRSVRTAVVGKLGMQADSREAALMLESVASDTTQAMSNEEWPLAYHAVEALLLLGDDGRTTLRRLSQAKAIANPVARARLEQLSRSNFMVKQSGLPSTQ